MAAFDAGVEISVGGGLPKVEAASPMSAERNRDLRLEIAHVLFMDIVGYSKCATDQQRELLEQLNEVVHASKQVQAAASELIRLPTGDGIALVFRTSPEAPAQCAIEISRALKQYPELGVRMGIHSGPVDAVADVNGRPNIAGAGINTAQRVMDCGEAGHILISKRVAEDLAQHRKWQPLLHELGECEVKHGSRVHLFNFYGDDFGNPNTPKKFASARNESASPRIGRRLIVVSIVLLAIGLFALLFTRAKGPTLTSGSAAFLTDKSIAVLPFENLSRDPDNAYFTDGIQEEILTRLAKVADLKVISRTSTARYKSSPDNLPEIATKLGVANILEGSVQRAADQVRINVQLIKAGTDAHLWADTYDRKLTDIFAVESEIAQAIADTLKAKLTGSEKRAIASRPTENTEAYQLYLKGRFFWNKRTGDNLEKALKYFNQAAEQDPSFAPAYAGIADVYQLLPLYRDVAPADALPKAKAAAEKALELDETLGEAHNSLAMNLEWYDFDTARSIREFERAIELNPNYATAHHWFGSATLLNAGRFDRAFAEMKRAVELDPLSVVINADLGQTYMWSHRYDEAIAQLRKAIELDPRFAYAHWMLGQAFDLKGELREAIAEYEKAVELEGGSHPLALLGQAQAKIGNRDKAQTILRQLQETAKQRYVSEYDFVLFYLGSGDKTQALDWLDTAYQQRNPDIRSIRVDPFFDPLRGDPRFEKLVGKIFGSEKTPAP